MTENKTLSNILEEYPCDIYTLDIVEKRVLDTLPRIAEEFYKDFSDTEEVEQELIRVMKKHLLGDAEQNEERGGE